MGITLEIKALRESKWIGIIGIILSLFFSFLTFYPVCQFFTQDLALYINFVN